MNLINNPIFLGKVVKSYFFDTDRLWKLSENEIKKLQNKLFKKTRSKNSL